METLTPSVITGWSDFFTAQAGVFAALTGLVFVSLSINLKEILAGTGLVRRAAEAIVVLIEPVFIGMLGLVANQTLRSLGIEELVVSAAGWATVSTILMRQRSGLGQSTRSQLVSRVLIVQASTLLLVIGASLLIAHGTAGFYFLGAGSGGCLMAGLIDAWVLLVEIMR